jgi:hypothetical protein
VRPIFAASLAALMAAVFGHDPLEALFLDLFGHRIGQALACAPSTGSKPERTNAVELCFVQPVEQVLEIRLGLAGEADDEAGADRDIGAIARQLRAFEHLGFVRGRFIAFSTIGRGVLERNVEIRRQQTSAISGITSSTCG